MVNKKLRRHSGRVTLNEGDRHTTYWDDWNDWRDGMRDKYGSDRSKIVNKFEADKFKIPEKHSVKSWRRKFIHYIEDTYNKIHKNNEKLKRLIQRRKARQIWQRGKINQKI